VFHSAEMLTRLEKKYDARWNSELRGPHEAAAPSTQEARSAGLASHAKRLRR
jgi:hypothetical protein